VNPSPGQLPATSVVVDGGSAGGDHLLGKTSGPLFSDKIPYSFSALQVFTKHLRKCALGAAKKKTIPVRVYINTIPINKSLRNHRMRCVLFRSVSLPPKQRPPRLAFPRAGARVLTRIHAPAACAAARRCADRIFAGARGGSALISSRKGRAGPRRRRREGTFVRRMTRTLVWLHDCGVCRGGLAGGKARKRSPPSISCQQRALPMMFTCCSLRCGAVRC
jgi:hypothetical protein